MKSTNEIVLLKKQELKSKKNIKTLHQLEACKSNGGPITKECLCILDKLNEKELLAEISFLRLTVAPDIIQMRRIKVNDKYKMQKF